MNGSLSINPISPMLLSLQSLGCIQIRGDEAAKFLQGQLTCDVTQVGTGLGLLGAYCNPQGRIIASFYLTQKEQDYFLILPKTMINVVATKLAKIAVFSKVSVTDKSDSNFIFGFSLASSLETNILSQIQHAKWLVFQCFPQFYLMLIEVDQKDRVIDLFAKFDLTTEIEDLWKDLHIQKGITIIYPETSEMVTPHMINYPQLGAVAFNKGCYVGQEIIARTHYLGKTKRKLIQWTITSTVAPQIGNKLFVENQEVGVIMDSCRLNDSEYRLLAVIQDHVLVSQITIFS